MKDVKDKLDLFNTILIGDMLNDTYKEFFIEIRINNKYSKCCSILQMLPSMQILREKSLSGNEILFGPAYRKNDLGTKCSDRRNIVMSNCFWLDIVSQDINKPIEKQHEGMKSTLATLITNLLHYNLTPTFVLSSGYVFHIFFIMETRFPAPFNDLVKIQKALVKMCYGLVIPDIASLIHLPGTFNHRDPQRPQPVTLIHDYRDLYGYDYQTGYRAFEKTHFQEILKIK